MENAHEKKEEEEENSNEEDPNEEDPNEEDPNEEDPNEKSTDNFNNIFILFIMTKKQIDRFFPPRSDFFKIPSESERVLKEIYTTNKQLKQRSKRWLYSSIILSGLTFGIGFASGYLLANRTNQRNNNTIILT